jgi:hypothetical protein
MKKGDAYPPKFYSATFGDKPRVKTIECVRVSGSLRMTAR